MYFHLEIAYQDGLYIQANVSPVLLGVILSIVAVWLPELKPLLNLIAGRAAE